MKNKFILLLILAFFCIPAFADLESIENEYSMLMQSATSNSQMNNYTINASKAQELEAKNISLQLNKILNSEQKNILEQNTKLWNEYTDKLKNSTIQILYNQLGTIYQSFATSTIHSNNFTRALTLYYLLENSIYKQHDYISQELENCLKSSENNIASCNCYYKEIDKYKVDMSKELELTSSKVNTDEYNKILSAHTSWENYLNHTQSKLFKIIDSINTTDKELKKAEIIFRIYQTRYSELSNINFID